MMKSNTKQQRLLLGCMGIFAAFLTIYGCEKKEVIKQADEAALTAPQSITGSFTTLATTAITGINGHPLNNIVYDGLSTINGVDYTTQSNMVKAMGMTYYRIDVQTDSLGKATQESRLLDIIAKCTANNIKILPMISDKCSYKDTATTANSYRRAFKQMKGFATKYGQYFDYYELGNEWELFDTLLYRDGRNAHNGRNSTDYDLRRVGLAEQYVKGMEEGLKSVLPTKQTIVNTAGYFPTYWMDRMFAAAPSINICGWHLYADMPANYASQINVPDIHQYLTDRYNRPIWYTESGYRFKTTLSQADNETASNNWRETLTVQVNAHPNVKAMIFYELLDEPERTDFAHPNFVEENFGWVKFNNYPGKTDLTAWNAWKANPDRYQDWSYKTPAAELIGPDLIITDITWSPSSPHVGNSVVFTATVKNVGLAATPAGVIVGVNFKVDGHSAGCNGSSNTSLAPGASRTLTSNSCSPMAWTAVLGSHTVVANVDDPAVGARIRESDETNNTRTQTITVAN